jgi:hypothetical protein
MRTALLSLFAASAFTAFAAEQRPLDQADQAYFDALALAEAQYRKAMASALEGADKIELFLLDFEHQRSPDAEFDSVWDTRLPDGFFPIIPYRSQSRILERKILSADEKRQLLPPLKQTVAVEENTGGAMCHFPIHGIRAWVGEEILFQTSLCWHCSNFYIKYPSSAHWTGLSTGELQAVCERLLPIPKREIDRFSAKFKSTEKKDHGKHKTK